MSSIRRQAKTAGMPYFLASLPAPFALAYLFVRLHGQGIIVAEIFWGLWLFPFGVLVIRSGFIPRVLGFPLFVAGSGYVVSALTSLLLPAYAHIVSQFTRALSFAELPIVLWLLIWGAKGPMASAEPVSASGCVVTGQRGE